MDRRERVEIGGPDQCAQPAHASDTSLFGRRKNIRSKKKEKRQQQSHGTEWQHNAHALEPELHREGAGGLLGEGRVAVPYAHHLARHVRPGTRERAFVSHEWEP